MKSCPSCGKEIEEEAPFCKFCNYALSHVPAAGQPNQPQTSRKAVASLILGFLSFLFPAAILAVVFGHLSRSEIKRNAGRLKGKGMALTGLILGYSGLAILALLIVIPSVVPVRPGIKPTPVGCLRTINTAEITFAATYSKGYSSSLAELRSPPPGKEPSAEAAGLIDEALASGSEAAYRFVYTPGKKDSDGRVTTYTIQANPVTPGTTGTKFYFTEKSGIVREDSDRPATAKSPPIH